MKTYCFETKIGDNVLYLSHSVTNIGDWLKKVFFIVHLFSVGFLFYLNSIYIHSRLFAILLFIFGLLYLAAFSLKEKIYNKEEYIAKITELLKD
ncbi:MAG: hypothetical protein NC191_06985 [Muribaculaceae bacterium]|nr:hypothetical protein [Muribaculaceae bacterium]